MTIGASSPPEPGLGTGVTNEAEDVVVDVAEDEVDSGSFEEVVGVELVDVVSIGELDDVRGAVGADVRAGLAGYIILIASNNPSLSYFAVYLAASYVDTNS